jgi:SAM-dependent methyltransferase
VSLRAAAKRLLGPPRVRRLPLGPARGIRLEVDFQHQTRMYLGLYETELNRHLRELCAPGAAVYDVGAQFGYHSLVFAKLGAARVAAFEADADAAVVAEANVRLNADAELIQVVRAFVGKASDGGGRLALDDFAFGPGFVPDFVKIDVEGAEADVLAGAGRLLAERMPSLIVETHSQALEASCGDLLVECGYRPRIVSPRRRFSDLRPTEHNRWLVARGR